MNRTAPATHSPAGAFLMGGDAICHRVPVRRDAGQVTPVAPVDFFGGTPFDGHPVAFQHEQIARELLGPIRKLTGW